MSIASEHARMEAMDLPVGETMANILCPVCAGGNTGDATFSITRYPTKLAYICYRDSCETKGYVDDLGNTDFRRDPHLKEKARKTIKPYEGTIAPLTEADKQYFWERFEIPPLTASRLIRGGDYGWYVLPVFSWEARIVGHVIRQPSWKGEPVAPRDYSKDWTGPKALTRMKEVVVEAMSFYGTALKGPVILVEDQISAIKLIAYGYRAVALLGTHVNLTKVRDIQRAGVTEIIIALDEDANQTAFKIARDFGLAFNHVRVALMPVDVKDFPADDFPSLFGEPNAR